MPLMDGDTAASAPRFRDWHGDNGIASAEMGMHDTLLKQRGLLIGGKIPSFVIAIVVLAVN